MRKLWRDNRLEIISAAAALLVYGSNRFLLFRTLHGQLLLFSRCYLNDLAAPIFYLAASQIILYGLGIKLRQAPILFAIGIAVGIFWEYGAPMLNPRSVSDPLDLVCYAVGTLIYCGIHRHVVRRHARRAESVNSNTA